MYISYVREINFNYIKILMYLYRHINIPSYFIQLQVSMKKNLKYLATYSSIISHDLKKKTMQDSLKICNVQTYIRKGIMWSIAKVGKSYLSLRVLGHRTNPLINSPFYSIKETWSSWIHNNTFIKHWYHSTHFLSFV